MEDKMQQIFERFPTGTTGYLPLLIGYRTGLRLSEIFALVWDDIDFKNKTLTVNRQVLWKDVPRDDGEVRRANGTSESNGFWYFVPPKYKSYRTISLDDNLVEILKAEKVKQDKAKAYYDATNITTIGMDNNLFIEELPEEKQPGTYVRRINGKELNDEEMIEYYT